MEFCIITIMKIWTMCFNVSFILCFSYSNTLGIQTWNGGYFVHNVRHVRGLRIYLSRAESDDASPLPVT